MATLSWMFQFCVLSFITFADDSINDSLQSDVKHLMGLGRIVCA